MSRSGHRPLAHDAFENADGGGRGYGRLLDADEEGMLTRLKKRLAIFQFLSEGE